MKPSTYAKPLCLYGRCPTCKGLRQPLKLTTTQNGHTSTLTRLVCENGHDSDGADLLTLEVGPVQIPVQIVDPPAR